MSGVDTIIWVVSYPKSGNTMIRCIAQGLAGDSGFDLNRIGSVCPSFHGLCRNRLEAEEKLKGSIFALGVEASYWHSIQEDWLELATKRGQLPFLKCHHAFLNTGGQILLNPNLKHKIIYIVRHPVSVIKSLANFKAIDVTEAISQFENDDNMNLGAHQLSRHGVEVTSSWAKHVSSWYHSGQDLLWLRYESAANNLHATVELVAEFIGGSMQPTALAELAQAINLNNLIETEVSNGFVESSPHGRFFGDTDHADEGETRRIWAQLTERSKNVASSLGYGEFPSYCQ